MNREEWEKYDFSEEEEAEVLEQKGFARLPAPVPAPTIHPHAVPIPAIRLSIRSRFPDQESTPTKFPHHHPH
jgi:hypothetical protein